MRITLLIATLTLGQAQPGNGQAASFTCWIRGPADKLAERPSPLDSSAVQLGGGTIKLCYGRPSARGRKVMGELVPFGQPWRLGANEGSRSASRGDSAPTKPRASTSRSRRRSRGCGWSRGRTRCT